MWNGRHLSGECRLDAACQSAVLFTFSFAWTFYVIDSCRNNHHDPQVGQTLTPRINKTLIYCDIPLIDGLGEGGKVQAVGSRTGRAQPSPIYE